MSTHHLTTVTIGVSALNEEQNIVQFLHSILSQKEIGFHIEKIIIISDGSTDATVAKAQSVHDDRIEIRAYPERQGQPTRMNELFRSVTSDILVKCDADIILAHSTVIAELVSVFQHPRVGMACGSGRPFHPKTLMEKSVAMTREAYMALLRVKNGHTRHFVNGRLMAFRASLVRNITIPAETIGNDVYCYFACLMQQYEFRRVGAAVAYYRAPLSIREHIQQNTRFISVSNRMYTYFPRELVDTERRIPRFLLGKAMLKQAIRHPVLAVFTAAINGYCRYLRFISFPHHFTSEWEIATTSKRIDL